MVLKVVPAGVAVAVVDNLLAGVEVALWGGYGLSFITIMVIIVFIKYIDYRFQIADSSPPALPAGFILLFKKLLPLKHRSPEH